MKSENVISSMMILKEKKIMRAYQHKHKKYTQNNLLLSIIEFISYRYVYLRRKKRQQQILVFTAEQKRIMAW